MLSTCASGVSVVNIDNGFGAAMCGLRIVANANESANRQGRQERQGWIRPR